MVRKVISPQTSVAELLRRNPKAAIVFLRHRMACVGCVMSSFDSLADAANNYGMEPADFIAEIEDQTTGGE